MFRWTGPEDACFPGRSNGNRCSPANSSLGRPRSLATDSIYVYLEIIEPVAE